jgi:hypothetical protein
MAHNRGTHRRTGRRWLWIVAGIAAAGAVCAVVGLLTAAALTAALIALHETRQANAEIRRANGNTHVRELYATAISQLGDVSLDVRLGGIYALERVARDSAADQRTVVEVLSAFSRVHSTDPALRPTSPDPAHPIRPTIDVHAAITVLARLPTLPDIPRADLTGANLTGPAHLQHLQAPHSNLRVADLRVADLSAADLHAANLHGANLRDAILRDANRPANMARATPEVTEIVAIDVSGREYRLVLSEVIAQFQLRFGALVVPNDAEIVEILARSPSVSTTGRLSSRSVSEMSAGRAGWSSAEGGA